MLAFCYSINGDLVMLLRKCGFFSKMIINHDLKIITKNPNAWLNPIQEELLSNIGAFLSFCCDLTSIIIYHLQLRTLS